jgi:SET domain-containing protein
MNPSILNLLAFSYCRLQPSPIHGIGVFAIRPIPKGLNPMQELRETDFLSVPKSEVDALPPELKKLAVDMCPENDGVFDFPDYSLNELGISFYLNHSITPNMLEKDGDFYATRDIEAGEEITVDYGTYGEVNL